MRLRAKSYFNEMRPHFIILYLIENLSIILFFIRDIRDNSSFLYLRYSDIASRSIDIYRKSSREKIDII